MQIGILQTGHAPDALIAQSGDYPSMFERLLGGRDFSFRTWAVVDGQMPSDVHQAEGWLITGSRHGAYEDHPWIAPLEDFIRAAYAARVPLVGICFGHQIIAQALGGRVEKFRGGWSVGPTEYDFGDQTLRLNAWHQDQVVVRPEGAKVLARNDFCENSALIYDDRALTVQAHPEFRSDFIGGLIDKRGRGLVPESVLDGAVARLDRPIDDGLIADRIATFFRQPRT